MKSSLTRNVWIPCVLLLSVTVLGCSGSKTSSNGPDDVMIVEDTADINTPVGNVCLPPETGPPFQVAERADLRWKRVSPLARDLLRALALDENACGELGVSGVCFSQVHRVALGGYDPAMNAMHEPIEAPRITSALALDRVVIGLCGQRVDRDHANAQSGTNPVVFTALNWQSAAVNPTDSAVSDTITGMYRRLLGRNPNASEMETARRLAEPLNGQATTPREFAKSLCFVIATTTEMVLH